MPESGQFKIITMDGGAAVGKSSTCRGLAQRLQLMHVDTGAHYRALTCALLRAGAAANRPETLFKTLDTLELNTAVEDHRARLSINNEVLAETDLRSAAVNAEVSKFAAIPQVRRKLFDYQRSLADLARTRGYAGLIMEGRDIGSIIFPDAEYRFFLHADEATRNARRAKEGQIDSISQRDKMDKGRKTAPLVSPQGAILIDTTHHCLEEVIEKIAQLITKDAAS